MTEGLRALIGLLALFLLARETIIMACDDKIFDKSAGSAWISLFILGGITAWGLM